MRGFSSHSFPSTTLGLEPLSLPGQCQWLRGSGALPGWCLHRAAVLAPGLQRRRKLLIALSATSGVSFSAAATRDSGCVPPTTTRVCGLSARQTRHGKVEPAGAGLGIPAHTPVLEQQGVCPQTSPNQGKAITNDSSD